MRKPIVVGNWKMQLLQSEAEKLISDIGDGLKNSDNSDIVVCPSFVHMPSVKKILPKNILLGGQDLYWENKGAYTGSVSGLQLKDVGCGYVIIGHSERRQYFGETDEDINKKIKAALNNNLIPIVCVGESEKEREAGGAEEVIGMQTEKALKNLKSEDVEKIIFAYEPVWAIGTGVFASPEDVIKIIKHIRKIIKDLYGVESSEVMRVIYGGSVDLGNIGDFSKEEDIDGVLAGGVSLRALDFVQIIEILEKQKNNT